MAYAFIKFIYRSLCVDINHSLCTYSILGELHPKSSCGVYQLVVEVKVPVVEERTRYFGRRGEEEESTRSFLGKVRKILTGFERQFTVAYILLPKISFSNPEHMIRLFFTVIIQRSNAFVFKLIFKAL